MRQKYSHELFLQKVQWETVEKIFSRDAKQFFDAKTSHAEVRIGMKEILKLLAAGGIVAMTAIVPVFPMVIAPFVLGSKKNQSYWRQSMSRLQNQKLAAVVYENGQPVVRITEKGRLRALRYKLDEVSVQKQKRWDKKWRVVIFDIPEKKRYMRDVFRIHLRKMGFYPLQKSVWVHAYPCFDEVEFLRQIYGVGINVTYVVAERIEESEAIQSHFELQ